MQILEQLNQPCVFRELHHFTVMQTLKQRKDNTSVISQCKTVQNTGQYLVSCQDIIVAAIYRPALRT